MSLYSVTINDREYHVRFNGSQAFVNGEPVQLNWTPLNTSGLHLLRRGRQAVEVHLSQPEPETLEFLIGSRRLLARVEAHHQRLRKRPAASNPQIAAPMPGLIVSILVQEGDSVTKGQTVAVLESMKMQMQLRAAQDARVARVLVQPGQQVEKSQALLSLSPLT